jgi:hypothetical protein
LVAICDDAFREVEFPALQPPAKEKTMYCLLGTASKQFLSVAFLLLAGSANLVYAADIVALTGKLSGASEVPGNASAGTGTLEATLDTKTKVLKWKVDYAGLSGPAGAGHFHGPAPAGQNAGVALGFKGSAESPITGEATLTPEQVDALLNGQWYVNLHTKAYPGGEIRAQVLPAK